MSGSESATFELHEEVRLAVPKEGFVAGTHGTVVDAYPENSRYTVELFDAERETLDLLGVLAHEIHKRPPRD